jgi:hypothetical protein
MRCCWCGPALVEDIVLLRYPEERIKAVIIIKTTELFLSIKTTVHLQLKGE